MSASERPRDKGGPRPENQLKRVELRKARGSLIGMLAIGAVGAITCAVRRDVPGLASASSSFIVAALLVGGGQAIAALLLVLRAPRARVVAAVAAVLVIVAGVAAVVSLVGPSWVPALVVFFGFLELLLIAGSTPRKPARRKHVPGHR